MQRVARARHEGIVAPVSSPSPDPATHAALTRLADEIAGVRKALAELTAENASLRRRLEQSETARADLVAQTEHIVELLADSRREIRALQAKAPGA